ncbi:MAG TPA: APC family permease [Candidatus Polarisedimenticolaceae bacterium]|nr:APC family permease [Candidatus Polarisedimenticolaceae bacterium]
MAQVQPRLGAFDTAMVVVSLVIGIGIFRTPAMVASASGTPALFFTAWLLGGLVSLAGALTFAEIGSRFPHAGAYYKVVADGYHPALGFMLNWSYVLMQGAGAAGVAFVGAEYLGRLVLPPDLRTPGNTLGLALALLVILLSANALGVRSGARTQNVLSVLKLAMIAGLVGVGWLLHPTAVTTPGAGAPSGNLLAACVAVFYCYGGYQNALNLAADVRGARRSLPLGIVGGMLAVTAAYLTLNAAYHHVLGVPGIAGATLVAADLARACLGPTGEAVISIAIFLSAAGFVNATILQLPRSYLAMAGDGLLPAAFARINARTQVQGFGLAFVAATMLIPAFFLGSFETLLNYVMFTDSVGLVLVASTVFVLRRRGTGKDEGTPFRVPLYPVLPLLYLACLVAICVYVAVTRPGLAMAGTGVLLAGWPLYLLLRRKPLQSGIPEPPPIE